MTARLVGLFSTGRRGMILLPPLLDGKPEGHSHPVKIVLLNTLNEPVPSRRVSRNTQAKVKARRLAGLSRLV